jgi:transcriptional antiterminator NusG
MNESPIDPSDEAAPEPSANADGDKVREEEPSANADGDKVREEEPSANADGEQVPDDAGEHERAPERLVEAFEEAAAQEAVADAAIEAALEETVAEAVQDASAVEAASDAAIEEAFEERVSEAVDSGMEGQELQDAVAQAAADADVQEAVADAAIEAALEETVAEAVQDASAVESMSDAAIVGGLADEVESIASDVERSEEPGEAEPASGAEPAAEAAPEAEPEPPAEPERAAKGKGRTRAKSKADAPGEDETEGSSDGRRDPFRGPGEWYVVHTYAGYENKVKTNLESRIHTMQMEDKIFDVHIPMEDVMEIKGGKKQVVQRKVFPGYLLVKMVYDNDSWYVVRNTPGVTGFVAAGTGSKPTPLSRREVEKILSVKKEEVKPQFRLGFEEGDVVRIISGPFADFNGTISEINLDQSKLKVLVNIFDRETPVELSFDQVAKV